MCERGRENARRGWEAMPPTASEHILETLEAAVAAVAQVESQIGDIDVTALNQTSERFVTSLSVGSFALNLPIYATVKVSPLPSMPSGCARQIEGGDRAPERGCAPRPNSRHVARSAAAAGTTVRVDTEAPAGNAGFSPR